MRGYTIFHNACKHANLNIISFLMKDDRININKKNNLGETPFFSACSTGNFNIIQLFLKNDSIDIKQNNNNGIPSFHFILISNDLNNKKLLLEDPRSDPNKMIPFIYNGNNNFFINHIRTKFNIRNFNMEELPKIEMTKKMAFLYAVADGNLNNNKKTNGITIYFGNKKKYWVSYTKEQYERIVWIKD